MLDLFFLFVSFILGAEWLLLFSGKEKWIRSIVESKVC